MRAFFYCCKFIIFVLKINVQMGRAFEYRKASKMARGDKMAKTFSKIGKDIAVAVKAGGRDPESNPALRRCIQNAKGANTPKDNVERAIKKASGADAENYEEITYEGYGPAGIAFMVKALTNNRNRTAADVRHIFDKNGGNLGVDGSVGFLFEEKGTIIISREDYEDEDAVMMDALDCGAADFSGDDEYYEITTSTADYYTVCEALQDKGYVFADSSLGPVAFNTVEVSDPVAVDQLEKMLDMMEENEDIQEVFHNWSN